jgi:hypothetical protein
MKVIIIVICIVLLILQILFYFRVFSNISKDSLLSWYYSKNILIYIVTSDIYLNTRIKAINNTWKKYVDNHPELGIKVIIVSESYGNIPVPKTSYNDLYIKVFNTLSGVWETYNDYKYFMKADDDLFINVENLFAYFYNKDGNDIEFLGFKDPYDKMCWGGPGYVLSNKALNMIYPYIQDCINIFQNPEDIAVSQCLQYAYSKEYNNNIFFGCQNIDNFININEQKIWNHWNESNYIFSIPFSNKNTSFNDIITLHPFKSEKEIYPTMEMYYKKWYKNELQINKKKL